MRWAAEKTAPLEENESLRNIAEAYVKAVSYTHLDVYKRQIASGARNLFRTS